ncbi:MAG: hypothetical protein VB138_09880 [Burkholderia sp.]
MLTPRGVPKHSDVFTTAPLAVLLDLMGPHVEVELRAPSNHEADTGYISLASIAHVLPTALESGVLLLHLLNGEEVAVGDVGGIKEFVANAQSVL